jgi:membrane protein
MAATLIERLGQGARVAGRVVRRVFDGFWEDDGFILAGHLAYLALLVVFPFCLLLVWLAGRFGRTEAGLQVIQGLLETLPPRIAEVLQGPITQVVGQSGHGFLTLGLLVGLWTTGSLIETIRVVIHKAYNHSPGRPFWQYRLQSSAVVIGSALLLLLAFAAQIAAAGIAQYVEGYVPAATEVLRLLDLYKTWITPAVLLLALIGLFYTLTPRNVRGQRQWPGALVVVLIWIATAVLLPQAIAAMGTYDLTYGSLAGVMITLLFFYLAGAGLVAGAQVNAALAELAR